MTEIHNSGVIHNTLRRASSYLPSIHVLSPYPYSARIGACFSPVSLS